MGAACDFFDVVIVGAGPAGGHCARKLSQLGHRVLLIERYTTRTLMLIVFRVLEPQMKH